MAWRHVDRESVNLTALDCVQVRRDGDEMTSGVRPAIRQRVPKVVEIADGCLCASYCPKLVRLRRREVEPRSSQCAHGELQFGQLIGH